LVVWGKAMANYPYGLAQDAAYQSRMGRLTGLWFLPKLAQGPNTTTNNNWSYRSMINNQCTCH
jgi:hypothetical protein